MLRSAFYCLFLSLFALFLTGCLVVKSDVAKLDDESGALTLEIDATSTTDRHIDRYYPHTWSSRIRVVYYFLLLS